MALSEFWLGFVMGAVGTLALLLFMALVGFMMT